MNTDNINIQLRNITAQQYIDEKYREHSQFIYNKYQFLRYVYLFILITYYTTRYGKVDYVHPVSVVGVLFTLCMYLLLIDKYELLAHNYLEKRYYKNNFLF